MILCADVGNTSVKLARVSERRVVRVASLPTEPMLAKPKKLDRLLSLRDVGPVDGVALCSVVPRLTSPLARALSRLTGCQPAIVTHRGPLPFRLGVARPAELGTDRLCAAAGALGAHRSVIVADVGSATTVDLVHDGVYLGGYILAGPQLGLTALSCAAQLPELDYRARRRVSAPFGSTVASMDAGATIGAVGALQEAVRRHRQRAGARTAVVLTGGWASGLRAHLPNSWIYHPDVVAQGLLRIWLLDH